MLPAFCVFVNKLCKLNFATKEMAEEALKKDREVIGNRYIEIFPSRKSEIQVQYGRGRIETSSFTPGAEDTPRTKKAANSSSISTTHNFIHMRGLPYDSTGEDIVKVKFYIEFILFKIQHYF